VNVDFTTTHAQRKRHTVERYIYLNIIMLTFFLTHLRKNRMLFESYVLYFDKYYVIIRKPNDEQIVTYLLQVHWIQRVIINYLKMNRKLQYVMALFLLIHFTAATDENITNILKMLLPECSYEESLDTGETTTNAISRF